MIRLLKHWNTAQSAQRGGGYPVPGDTQGHVGWGYKHLIEL